MGIFGGVIGIIIGVAGAVAVGSALSKSFRRTIKKIGRAVGKALHKTFDVLWNIPGLILTAAGKLVEGLGSVVKFLGANKLGNLIKGVGGYIHALNSYIKDNFGNALESLVTGHLKDGLLGIVNVASLVGQAIIAYVNPYLIPAVLITSDMQVNQGKAFARPVTDFLASALEKAGWEKAKEYKDALMLALGFGAGIFTAFAGADVFKILGLGSNIQTIYNIAVSAMAIYGGYVTIKDYQELKELLEKDLERLREYYLALEQKKKESENRRFRAFLEYNIYDYCAGGKMYNSFSVGEQNYDPCYVQEPYTTLLALPESKKLDEFSSNLINYKSLNEFDGFMEGFLQVDTLVAVKTINKKYGNKGDSVIIREITDSAEFYWSFVNVEKRASLNDFGERITDENNLVGAINFINARLKHNIPITTSETIRPIYETNEKGEKVFVKNETITIKHTPIEDENNWKNYAGVSFSVVRNKTWLTPKKVRVSVTYTTTQLI